MLRNNLILVFISFFLTSPVVSITLEELNYPMPPANRLGVGQNPEAPFKEVKTVNEGKTETSKTGIKEAAYDAYYEDLR